MRIDTLTLPAAILALGSDCSTDEHVTPGGAQGINETQVQMFDPKSSKFNSNILLDPVLSHEAVYSIKQVKY